MERSNLVRRQVHSCYAVSLPTHRAVRVRNIAHRAATKRNGTSLLSSAEGRADAPRSYDYGTRRLQTSAIARASVAQGLAARADGPSSGSGSGSTSSPQDELLKRLLPDNLRLPVEKKVADSVVRHVLSEMEEIEGFSEMERRESGSVLVRTDERIRNGMCAFLDGL